MAKMFGVPFEIIRSKKKFATLMTSGFETILSKSSKSKIKVHDDNTAKTQKSLKNLHQQKRNLNGGSSPY
jgi:hypothetical protein